VFSHLAAIDPLESAGPLMVWLVVLTFVYAESAFLVGVFLPGDSLLLAAGVVLAQHQHEFDAWALSVGTIVVSVAGNHTGYVIGGAAGGKLVARRDGRVLNRRNLERAGWFLEHWGFWSVVVARWLPFVRTIAPMLAGAAAMERRRYFLASLVGGVVWGPPLLLLGYYGSGVLDVYPWVKPVVAVAVVVALAGGTVYGLFRYRQEMRHPADEDATLVSALHE
jgi:membrane-associated protein